MRSYQEITAAANQRRFRIEYALMATALIIGIIAALSDINHSLGQLM